MEIITLGIIDDHMLFMKSLVTLLRQYCDVRVKLTAENGQEFLNKLEDVELPDVILMDISMPVMDGPKTTKILVEKYPDCKVIALSGYSGKSYISKMILSGVCGFLSKNINPEDLINAIIKANDGGLPFNEEALEVLRSIYIEDEDNKDTKSKYTNHELKIIDLICHEKTNNEIAESLGISKNTVEVHKRKLIQKMGVKNSVGIAVYAVRYGLVEFE
ncbi:MAG: hypothetical protein C0596_09560 [Marinilabiliales bacterium]|nr:MAG: hypothetical protein C0596_09560 [Marinilabiliales bacterium]